MAIDGRRTGKFCMRRFKLGMQDNQEATRKWRDETDDDGRLTLGGLWRCRARSGSVIQRSVRDPVPRGLCLTRFEHSSRAMTPSLRACVRGFYASASSGRLISPWSNNQRPWRISAELRGSSMSSSTVLPGRSAAEADLLDTVFGETIQARRRLLDGTGSEKAWASSDARDNVVKQYMEPSL